MAENQTPDFSGERKATLEPTPGVTVRISKRRRCPAVCFCPILLTVVAGVLG